MKLQRTLLGQLLALLGGLWSWHAVSADVLPPARLSLAGSDWWLREDPAATGLKQKFYQNPVPATDWIPAQVPGNVQADVEQAHKLRPVFYGATDPNLYEVAEKDWWYRKDFVVPASFEGRRLTLVFDGVDERCEIWLNGSKIGGNAGMFRRFEFDVTALARPGQTNQLAVWLARMPAELVPYIINSDGPGEKDPFGPFGFMTAVNRTREVLKDLKTPGNFSYDWAFNVWTLGIWKDVRLEATGPARIQWTRIESAVAKDFGSATVRATLEVDSPAEQPVQAKFQVTRMGTTLSSSVETVLKPGRNLVATEIPVDRPALWWPAGQGEQPLYTLEAKLTLPDGTLSDARSVRFGIRDLQWVYTEGAPTNYINRYQLVINGRKVRTIGSGLIHPGVFPACVSAHNLQLLHQAKACGINTLRINGGGGGSLFNEEWYNLADELGIMIQSEFPIGNSTEGRPETDEVFLRNLEISCRSMIKEARNHPCIIEFGGGNEMEWDEASKHPALQVMRKVLAEETTTLFRATSPDLGGKHCPWDFDILGGNTGERWEAMPNLGYVASYAHYNSFLQSTKNPATETMSYSEMGTCSPSHLEVWYRDAPLASQWPLEDVDDPVLVRKNATRAVFSSEHWLMKKRIETVFGPLDNLPEVIAAGQYLGADGLRYIYDELRRKGLRLANITSHCYSEPHPNLAGSYLVDYAGRTLMNYDFLQQAISPISLSLRIGDAFYKPADGVKAELSLVSDAAQSGSGIRWSWLARDRNGKVFDRGSGVADMQPLEVKMLGTINPKLSGKEATGLVFVEMRVESADGKPLTERVQVFGERGQKGPFAGLLKNHDPKTANNPVRRTALTVKAAPVRLEGDQEVLELEMHNTGSMTALFCEPHPVLYYRTDLIVENNNCFIPPGETRTIVIRSPRVPACGLSLAQTGWRISCWNADDLTVAPDKSVLLTVGRRDEMCREFAGYFLPQSIKGTEVTNCGGNRPPADSLPYRLKVGGEARFEFNLATDQAIQPARLRLHTADQSKTDQTIIEVELNGQKMERLLPKGLGIQSRDPAHLAFPATVEFDVPKSQLRKGKNRLTVSVKGDGWFTWDSLDLVTD